MAKIEIELVAGCIKKNAPDLTPDVLRKIIEDLQFEAQPEPGEEKEPAPKKQFAILVSDPQGVMPKCDLVGWVLQVPEAESVATTQDRLLESAHAFNATKRGQLHPVATVGEAIEALPAKITKERGLWVKTRTPVLVLRTDNAIPKG